MKYKIRTSRQRQEVLCAIDEYSHSKFGLRSISLNAAVNDLRKRLPELGMNDRSLATVIAEAAFKKHLWVWVDLKSPSS